MYGVHACAPLCQSHAAARVCAGDSADENDSPHASAGMCVRCTGGFCISCEPVR